MSYVITKHNYLFDFCKKICILQLDKSKLLYAYSFELKQFLCSWKKFILPRMYFFLIRCKCLWQTLSTFWQTLKNESWYLFQDFICFSGKCWMYWVHKFWVVEISIISLAYNIGGRSFLSQGQYEFQVVVYLPHTYFGMIMAGC